MSSHPVWVRGLKYGWRHGSSGNARVAPRVGAWIEIGKKLINSVAGSRSYPVLLRRLKYQKAFLMNPPSHICREAFLLSWVWYIYFERYQKNGRRFPSPEGMWLSDYIPGASIAFLRAGSVYMIFFHFFRQRRQFFFRKIREVLQVVQKFLHTFIDSCPGRLHKKVGDQRC